MPSNGRNHGHLNFLGQLLKNGCEAGNDFLNHGGVTVIHVPQHIVQIGVRHLLKVSLGVLAVVSNHVKEEAWSLQFGAVSKESVDFVVGLTCFVLGDVSDHFGIGHQNVLNALGVVNCFG